MSITILDLDVSAVVETDANKTLISAAKGTAYNKDFGTTAGTVSEGNHNHGTGTTNRLSLFTDGATGAIGDSVVRESSGKIGIGVSPDHYLDVYKEADENVLVGIGNSNTGTDGLMLGLLSGNDGAVIRTTAYGRRIKLQGETSTPGIFSTAMEVGRNNSNDGDIVIISDELSLSSLTGSRILELDASSSVISVAKNTGYNLSLGTTAGTVAEGDHNHGTGTDNYLPMFSSGATGALTDSIIYISAGYGICAGSFEAQGNVQISVASGGIFKGHGMYFYPKAAASALVGEVFLNSDSGNQPYIRVSATQVCPLLMGDEETA